MFVHTPIEQKVNHTGGENKFKKNADKKQLKSPKSQLNVLFLAPHPFYQDRGTPIADDLMLKVLSERGEQVDVVAYPEGDVVTYGENVRLHRARYLPFVRNIRPGFSWKKLVYDVLIILKITSLVSKKRYDLVHAVEETVFMALGLKALLKIPYVYDMDSSLAQQMVEKYPFLEKIKISGILQWFEKMAVKNATVVVPVCQALADDMADAKPKKVVILPDVSLLKAEKKTPEDDIKMQLQLSNLTLMYVGNLESYQGIDLLLESLSLVLKKTEKIDLVIVGGATEDIQKYQAKADSLGLGKQVHFLGQKPASQLGTYLSQADILVSPRTKGKNTPMKIYSYLDSGKAVLATDLPTHTQVLNQENAMLAEARPEDFAQKMVSLISDPQLRLKLGMAGKMLIQEKHSYNAYRQKVNKLYDWLTVEILKPEKTRV
jgi:glycosyltransferase involved in cell wall biosynthesis